MEVLQRFDFSSFIGTTLPVKLQESTEEKSGTPYPFRTVVVIVSFGNMEIIAVVAVDVIGAIVYVGGVKCAHTRRATENSVGKGQALQGMRGIKEFRRHNHCDSPVGTELVISMAPGGLVGIFVDAAAIDVFYVNIVLDEFSGILRVRKTMKWKIPLGTKKQCSNEFWTLSFHAFHLINLVDPSPP
jgi:hypothetical protein